MLTSVLTSSKSEISRTTTITTVIVEEPEFPMADNRTMAQMLQAPIEGYEDAIVVPTINANNFELKQTLINLVQNVAALTTEVSELKNMMKTMLIDKQKAQAPAPVKAVEQSCVTCGGAHSYRNCPATDGNNYRDNIQEYVSQAVAANFNQGNTNSRPPMVSNQIRPPGFPPIQNNQNRFNQNQGTNFNQNRGTNFNQNRGNNLNQGQVYQPPTNQTSVYQVPPYQVPTPQIQGVSRTDFETYVKANDAVLKNVLFQVKPSREHVNAITTRSGRTCEGPSTLLVPTPVVSTPPKEPEQNPETLTEKVQNPNLENTAHIPPPEEEESIFMEIS
ncbi:hypothetical protein Tco_0844441 [Tanacetum coccineum]